LLEGTVRGTAGIRVVDGTCATTVPGLFAAGDAATRQLICGGFTGGGSHNAAWAMSSGRWAGDGAARFARSLGVRPADRSVRGTGVAGLPNAELTSSTYDADEVIAGVQGEMFPLDKNLFRSDRGLRASLGVLDGLWDDVHGAAAAVTAREVQKAREAAALVATARWAYASALARRETRGMHRRTDYPALDENQQHTLVVSGLDDLWVRSATNAPPVGDLREAIAV
jgi:succinate dehydrogenase/fumarate reductase flavoprotein subunit